MPRVTIKHKKESIVPFAEDSIKVINEMINLDDKRDELEKYDFERDGWYYYIRKSVLGIRKINNKSFIEIRIIRTNYRPGNIKYYTDQPKGNRIKESSWVYEEGMNCCIEDGIDYGYIADGFSFSYYDKKMF